MKLRQLVLASGAALLIAAPAATAHVTADPHYTSQPGLGPHLWPAPMTTTRHASVNLRAKIAKHTIALDQSTVTAMIRVYRAESDTQSL